MVSLLFAIFGIQSINAQSDDPLDHVVYQGYAVGHWIESYWEGTICYNIQDPSSLPDLEENVIYGIMYVESSDGGDGIYHDMGRNFQWINYDAEDADGYFIEYQMFDDGLSVIKTPTGYLLRGSYFSFDTTGVSLIIYE